MLRAVCREHDHRFDDGMSVLSDAELEAGSKMTSTLRNLPVHTNGPDCRTATAHLHSGREVSTYTVWGATGRLGQLTDLVIGQKEWDFEYMFVDVLNDEFSRTVMVPISSVTLIDCHHQRVVTRLTKQELWSNPYLRFGLKPKSPARPSSFRDLQ